MSSPRRRLLLACALGWAAWLLPAEGRAASEAGASTFESAAKRYAPRDVDAIPDEAIPVPHVEPRPQSVPSVSDADAGPGDAQMRFALAEIAVTGNTLLPPRQIERVLTPFLGDAKSISDVQAARDALERAYQDEGFLTVAVTIPQQTIDAGFVRFEVIEARVGRVDVRNEGIDWFSDRSVMRHVRFARPGAMLRREDLDRDRRALNRDPDRAVQPSLREGEEPGLVDVDLIVSDRPPIHAGLELSNDRSLGQPDHRARASVRYGNLWGLEHEAGFAWEFAPERRFEDVQVYTGTYRAPMPWDAAQALSFYVSSSDTTTLLPFGGNAAALGKSLDMGATWSWQLPDLVGDERFSQTIALGVDRKHVDNLILIEGGLLPPSTLTYLPLRVQWQGAWAGEQAFTALSLGSRFHFAGTLDGGTRKDFRRNRCADPTNCFVDGTWVIWSGMLTHELRMPALLRTLAAGRFVELPASDGRSFRDDWVLALAAEGQLADEPLVPSEQFLAGGVDSVRGYLRSEAGGDQGWRSRVELRTPSWASFLGGRLRERAQLLAFYDAAGLITLGTRSREAPFAQTLRGTGVGVRASFLDALSTELLLASAREDTSVSSGLRYHFRVSADF